MNFIVELLSNNAAYAHWWFFALLILAGLNLPISEDLLIISSAVMAATIVPENLIKLFICVFLGCYFSDWLSYWMGRKLTPWLSRRKYLGRLVNHKRIDKINRFYEKYGVLTLIIGRFIPFGVRNFLFMSAGMGKMNFKKFMIVDGLACLLSNSTLFLIAFSLADHYPQLLELLHKMNITFFLTFLFIGIFLICYRLYKTRKKAVLPDEPKELEDESSDPVE